MLAYVEPVVAGIDDICTVKNARIMEMCNDTFNDLVDGLQGLKTSTIELVVVGYHGRV